MTAVLRAEHDLESYRRELTGYCYRMLGSPFDADDAVQETLVRAWQKIDGFEGRSSLRSWLYRIATNVCLDALRAGGRRAQPMDLSSPVPCTTAPVEVLPQETWVLPIADAALNDPSDRAVQNDSVRLAFVAALQHLPPRQRATLLLREVLAWSAADVAELLDTTVASVNSALQRARATLAVIDVGAPPEPLGPRERALLARYVAAFEAYDIDALVRLMHQDASISMPPFAMWLQGSRGPARLVPRLWPGLSRLDRACGRSERHAGVRPVEAEGGRRPRGLVAAGARAVRGPGQPRAPLPRPRAVRAVRAAGPAALTLTSPRPLGA